MCDRYEITDEVPSEGTGCRQNKNKKKKEHTHMKTPIIRVSLAFGNLMPDDTLITFSRSVHTLLYGAAGFTNIPVTATVLEAAIEAFATAKAAQSSGGKAATAEKNNKRADLVKLLKELAFYVQVTSDNNLAMLLSTGFEAVSTNRARVPLAKPAVLRVVTGMSGEALVTLTADKASRGSRGAGGGSGCHRHPGSLSAGGGQHQLAQHPDPGSGSRPVLCLPGPQLRRSHHVLGLERRARATRRVIPVMSRHPC